MLGYFKWLAVAVQNVVDVVNAPASSFEKIGHMCLIWNTTVDLFLHHNIMNNQSSW